MKNFRLLILVCLILISTKSNAQSISDISIKICDSIKSRNFTDSDTIQIQQIEVFTHFLTKYLLRQNDLEKINFKNDFNVLNYKVTRELNKTCETYKIKKASILPFSNLIEIDSVFSTEQSEKINTVAKEIRNKNKMEIVILSIDELYPDKNAEEFARNKLIDWSIGGVFKKGGIIIVFSKKLREVVISTTEISKQYLSNENCEKLVAEIMIPSFKNNDFYSGIYNSLIEIKHIIK